MADNIMKAKISLRSPSVTSNGSSNSGDKTPPTPSKLMINHGKPNFTIQRTTKAQQNGADGDVFANEKNNNYNAYKTASSQSYSRSNYNNNNNNNNNNSNNIVISTKLNGPFKPNNLAFAQRQSNPLNDNGNTNANANDNEASKVILRRTKIQEPPVKDNEDDSVPEFIRRQRRIQERLAKENILDFENRRSGYFTHVMISPTSPNRQSFGATMSSPPIVPALETPAPAPASAPAPEPASAPEPVHEPSVLTTSNEETTVEEEEQQNESTPSNGNEMLNEKNNNTIADEEEVAKAIEEVNKAVEGEGEVEVEVEGEIEGEDDDKDDHNAEAITTDVYTTSETTPQELVDHNLHVEHIEEDAAPPMNGNNIEEEYQETETKDTDSASEGNSAVQTVNIEETIADHIDNYESHVENHENNTEQNVVDTVTDQNREVLAADNKHIEVVEVHTSQVNGHDQNDITISHTNGHNGLSNSKSDLSDVTPVNFEPKTVVSFSKDLGSEPNKYPDTVKVVIENGTAIDEKLQELSKLKFNIEADEQDVQVTPVLRTD